MNIDDMQAGREMDALVAEKVMGWRSGIINDECRVVRLPYSGPGWERWSPSSDISAAWEVVEHLAKNNFRVWMGNVPDKERWLCAAMKRFPDGSESDGKMIEAPIAPLAICSAALTVVGK